MALRALSLASLLALTVAGAAQAQDAAPGYVDPSRIKEHWEVIGSDTKHVGTVDKVEGQSIKLTKNDPAAGGEHHSIPLDWVGTADAGKVSLKKTGDEAMASWKAADRPSGDAKK